MADTADSDCGMCLYASDIGVPVPGNVVAYVHPDCPVHNDRTAEETKPNA